MNKNIKSRNAQLDKILDSDFYKSSQAFNELLWNQKQAIRSEWKLQKIDLFPFTKYIKEGDQFFKTTWKLIDSSQKYFWLTTYAFNCSPTADATLYKMINAAKRGVHVVLFIDNVQHWARQQLLDQLMNAGGTVKILNPQFKWQSVKQYFTKDVWRRHHQKLIVTDNKAIIGSSNFQENYGGVKYGNRMFRDINFYAQNIILNQFRKHFIDVANYYEFQLDCRKLQHTKQQKVKKLNNVIQEQYSKEFPNSKFYFQQNYRLLHNDRYSKREIQNDIMDKISKSKKEIKIIQPYFFNMIRFNQALCNANRRGVESEIITSKNRQQLVFKNFLNSMFFHEVLKRGTKVYETKERMLHSKVYLFDGYHVNMGSMNNDRWSWIINNELNIGITSYRDYDQMIDYYQKLQKDSLKVSQKYRINLDKMSEISFWMNFLYFSEIVMGKYREIQEDCVYYETDIDQ